MAGRLATVTRRPGRLLVIRHGQTEWSRTGRHTGLTDVPLTEAGQSAARALTPVLSTVRPALCLTSPLQRAWRTAELAGLHPEPAPELEEWHYGPIEGRTTAEVRELAGDPAWDIWDSDLSALTGVRPTPDAFDGPPESLAQVGTRVAAVLDRCREVLVDGEVCVLVAHSHLLRILTACWLGMGPDAGRRLVLDAASLGVLGYERTTPVLLGWNQSG